MGVRYILRRENVIWEPVSMYIIKANRRSPILFEFLQHNLTLSPTALLPPPYPTALGLIGLSKKDDI
jgi:hypothetical protein